MSEIINVAVVKPLLDQLGWENFSIAEALDVIKKNQIAPAAVLAYLTALAASQSGLDDASISGCDAATGAKITGWLKAKGLVA